MVPIKIEIEDLVVEPLLYNVVHSAREFAPVIHLDARKEPRKSHISVPSLKTPKNSTPMTKRSSENKKVALGNLVQPSSRMSNHHHSYKHCNRLKSELHVKQVHMSNNRSYLKFSCHVCREKLQMHESLKQHRNPHKRRMHIKCQVCNRIFVGNRLLGIHMRIHIAGNSPGSHGLRQVFSEEGCVQAASVHAHQHVCDICGKTLEETS